MLTLPESAPAPAELGALAEPVAAARAADHAVGLWAGAAGVRLLTCGTDGVWITGRYAGELRLDGRSIRFEPRIGWPALAGWVEAATGLHAPRTVNAGEDGLMTISAMLWVAALDAASRHGPPAFRHDTPHVGTNVRGRVDVRRTVRLRARGDTTVASVHRVRDLDNPVARIVVAADRVLARRLGDVRWRTDRVEEVLGQLRTAVGRRTPAPGDGDLRRIRYTPITRPFKWAAEVSSLIVRQDPVATTAGRGRPQGLVVALADVHDGAVLAWAREARPDLRAERIGAGHLALHRRGEAPVTVDVLPGSDGGAAALQIGGQGVPRGLISVPAEAAAARAAIRRALADL